MRLNSRSFFRIILLLSFLFLPVQIASAATNGITLVIKKYGKQRFVEFQIEAAQTDDDCAVSLYGAKHRKLLRGDYSRALLLGTITANIHMQTVLMRNIPRMPESTASKKTALYFRAVAQCGTYNDTSPIKRLNILQTLSDRGVASPRKLLRIMQRRVLTNRFAVRAAFPALTFSRPVDLQSPGTHTNVLYVVAQEGIIYAFDNTSEVSSATTFLDLTGTVVFQGEQGLLGLAFHPDVQNNREFFVYYTEPVTNSVVVARYTISEASEYIANTTEERLLVVPQPRKNHNGGSIQFGPDGFLYIAVGDGGGGGDPFENGQNLTTLKGSILRIDVDAKDPGKEYSIPASNPFAGNDAGFREEIFAYGLRNPWRISFDPKTGALWAGDVGQGAYEEVNLIKSGRNYGWNTMEGRHCFNADSCDQTGLTLPLHEYGRTLGQSITGGYVYRGQTERRIQGMYVFADFLSGRIWALRRFGRRVAWTQLVNTDLFISSFGTDAHNQLYVLGFDGAIYTLEFN